MPTFLPFSTYFFENVQFVFAFMAFTCTLSPLSMEQTRANIRGSDWKSNEDKAEDKLYLFFHFCQFCLFLLGCSVLSSSPIDSNAETKLMMMIAIIMMIVIIVIIVIKFPKADHLKRLFVLITFLMMMMVMVVMMMTMMVVVVVADMVLVVV